MGISSGSAVHLDHLVALIMLRCGSGRFLLNLFTAAKMRTGMEVAKNKTNPNRQQTDAPKNSQNDPARKITWSENADLRLGHIFVSTHAFFFPSPTFFRLFVSSRARGNSNCKRAADSAKDEIKMVSN
jgi:hypothetical protein